MTKITEGNFFNLYLGNSDSNHKFEMKTYLSYNVVFSDCAIRWKCLILCEIYEWNK